MDVEKNILLKLITFLLITTLLISICINVYGTEDNFDTNRFDNSAATINEVDNLVNNTAGTVVAAMRIISVAIAIIVLLVIAMKYMVSSPGDRADIKKHSVAYVTGTLILFSVTQIIAFLIDIANSFSGVERLD